MEEYRISKSREEIVKLVQKKFESENLMTMWQKDPKTGMRTLRCDAKFSSIDIFEGIFSIEILDKQQFKDFNPNLETYFLLQVQDFVFKTKTSIVQPAEINTISFQIPHDVRLKELRLHPRIYINSSEKRFVSAIFENKENEFLTVEVACPIYNISRTGVCIIISKETLSSIKLNKKISLEGLSFFDALPNEMEAIVRNARIYTKRGFGKDDYYALGLEFQSTKPTS